MEAIYPWQQEVVLELNADLCQSSCILISHKAACRREMVLSVYACKNNRGTTLFDFVISCVPFSLGLKKPHPNLIWAWCFRHKPSRCPRLGKTLLRYQNIKNWSCVETIHLFFRSVDEVFLNVSLNLCIHLIRRTHKGGIKMLSARDWSEIRCKKLLNIL